LGLSALSSFSLVAFSFNNFLKGAIPYSCKRLLNGKSKSISFFISVIFRVNETTYAKIDIKSVTINPIVVNIIVSTFIWLEYA